MGGPEVLHGVGCAVLPQKLDARAEPAISGAIHSSHGQLVRPHDGRVQGIWPISATPGFSQHTTPTRCSIFTGPGSFLKCEVGKQPDEWLEQSDNLEKWEPNALTASDQRVLITQWVGAAMDKAVNRPEYRFRLFEKCGMAMTVDGSGDEYINLEGVDNRTALWMLHTQTTTRGAGQALVATDAGTRMA